MLRVGLVLAALALFAPVADGSRAAPTPSPTTAIFYYPWFGTPGHDGGYDHWEQNGHRPTADLASAFYPTRGVYSSSDPRVLDGQMSEIARAGIGEIVVSWWGRGSAVDERLPAVLASARAHSLEVAAHLEPYPVARSPAPLSTSPICGRSGSASSSSINATDFPAADWQPLMSSLSGVRVFAQTALAGYAKKGGFQGLYTYDTLTYRGAMFGRMCNAAHKLDLLCAPSVGPGYSAQRATGDSRVLGRSGGKTYDAMWKAAVHAGADVATITSYNEWNEGTQIEPACPREGYESYNGAWGEQGIAAERVYLNRTRLWTSRFKRDYLRRAPVDERG